MLSRKRSLVLWVPCAGQYCVYNTTSEVEVIGFLGQCTCHSAWPGFPICVSVCVFSPRLRFSRRERFAFPSRVTVQLITRATLNCVLVCVCVVVFFWFTNLLQRFNYWCVFVNFTVWDNHIAGGAEKSLLLPFNLLFLLFIRIKYAWGWRLNEKL